MADLPGETADSPARVEALGPEYREAAARLSDALSKPASDPQFVLQLGGAGLQLANRFDTAMKAVRVDFTLGRDAHRRHYGGGNGQMIARAVGAQPGVKPTVLDATAGLGRDAFVLAGLGCRVTLIERNAIVAALIEDGWQRALNDPETSEIAARMHLIHGDAIALMRQWQDAPPQVVYLDPMFPSRDKAALVKKEMRVFRWLVGNDDDAPALLETALKTASHRVVVKRPRKAPPIGGVAPGYTLEGRSSRFDVYPKKTLRTK